MPAPRISQNKLPSGTDTETVPSSREAPDMEAADMEAAGGSSLAALAAMLDGLTDACIITELDGRMRYANEAARTLLRMKGRATGRKIAAVLPERQALEIVEDAAAAGKPRAGVRTLTFSSEGPRNYTVSAVPFTAAGEGTCLRVALCAGKSFAVNAGSEESRSVLEKLGDPLSIIQGYLENLLDGAIKDPTTMRQCLSAMQRQAAAMQRALGGMRV